MKIFNNRGSEIITTPIVIAIGIMMISSLIVFSVKLLTPYIWYEKLSSTCLKYVFIMEEFGYLTNKEKSNLLNELESQGFDTSNIIIKCTNKRQNYGSRIYIKVDYLYKMSLPIVGDRTIPMEISKESVSKV